MIMMIVRCHVLTVYRCFSLLVTRVVRVVTSSRTICNDNDKANKYLENSDASV